MVSKARVVLTTAGPYSEHGGDVVVEACARQGRHYADLTGEYWFQRAMIDQFHEEPQRSGAKIVHAAGVDSIPSDLGTQLAIEQLERRGERAAHVKALFTHYAGSSSSGTNRTLESLAQLPESGQYDAAFCNDPYVLAPSAEGKVEGETITGWDERRFDRDFGRLGTPFFMAPINAPGDQPPVWRHRCQSVSRWVGSAGFGGRRHYGGHGEGRRRRVRCL